MMIALRSWWRWYRQRVHRDPIDWHLMGAPGIAAWWLTERMRKDDH